MIDIRRRPTQGQALVEFALVLPVMLLVLFGAIDFGRAIYAYNTVAEGVRQGSRLAVVDQTTTLVQARTVESAAGITLQTADITVCYKDPAATIAETVCTGPNANVARCSTASPPTYAIGCLAVVEATTVFTPLTPIISSIVSSIPINTRSVNPIEYVCPTASNATCP